MAVPAASIVPAWNGPWPPLATQQPQPAKKASIAAQAATARRASNRSSHAGSGARRTSVAAAQIAAARATGLAAIQASSPAGNAARAAGCSQYVETASVTAQENAARPPGTRPRPISSCPASVSSPFAHG